MRVSTHVISHVKFATGAWWLFVNGDDGDMYAVEITDLQAAKFISNGIPKWT